MAHDALAECSTPRMRQGAAARPDAPRRPPRRTLTERLARRRSARAVRRRASSRMHEAALAAIEGAADARAVGRPLRRAAVGSSTTSGVGRSLDTPLSADAAWRSEVRRRPPGRGDRSRADRRAGPHRPRLRARALNRRRGAEAHGASSTASTSARSGRADALQRRSTTRPSKSAQVVDADQHRLRASNCNRCSTRLAAQELLLRRDRGDAGRRRLLGRAGRRGFVAPSDRELAAGRTSRRGACGTQSDEWNEVVDAVRQPLSQQIVHDVRHGAFPMHNRRRALRRPLRVPHRLPRRVRRGALGKTPDTDGGRTREPRWSTPTSSGLALTTRSTPRSRSTRAPGCGKTFVLTERFLSHLDPAANVRASRPGSTSWSPSPSPTPPPARCATASAAKLPRAAHWRPPATSASPLAAVAAERSTAARVSTIHAFCAAGSIRDYAIELGRRPRRTRVLDPAEAAADAQVGMRSTTRSAPRLVCRDEGRARRPDLIDTRRAVRCWPKPASRACRAT